MLLFAYAIDPAVAELAGRFGNAVAYADDVLVSYDPGTTTAAEVIASAKECFTRIGLEIQPAKCHSTENGETIEYLGHPFKAAGECTISQSLVEKAQRVLGALTCNDLVSRTKQYTMFRQTVLAQINYGPLVEQGDQEQARACNKEIDKEIAKTFSDILGLNGFGISDEEAAILAVAQYESGGAEQVLPGAYYDVMRAHQQLVMSGVERLPRLKAAYFASEGYRSIAPPPSERPNALRMLAFTDQLTNDQLEMLLALQLDPQRVFMNPQNGRCPACGKQYKKGHEVICRVSMEECHAQHGAILRNLLQGMRAERRATVHQDRLREGNRTRLSDGYFCRKGGAKVYIDVSVVPTAPDMERRYREKARRQARDGEVLPFVVSQLGDIHPQSLERLRAAAPELSIAAIQRYVLIPLARAKARAMRRIAECTIERARRDDVAAQASQFYASESDRSNADPGGGGGGGPPPRQAQDEHPSERERAELPEGRAQQPN